MKRMNYYQATLLNDVRLDNVLLVELKLKLEKSKIRKK